ncbi:hypothetical protein BB560_002724 [Smittium megazygosporum]|uniref:Mitochondrial Rho GTPase n=1 Tax=Smittium megazygosporum TaxID=133381 RepID=A0A2T9ZE31_9FUNG|nr:hypothetical protein BB560_002724 [Smittium megazygosporum]
MRDEIRVLLLGEDGTGKSSLVTSFIKEDFLPNVQKIVPEVTIPPEVTPENVTTHIIDTQSGYEHRARLEAEIQKANVLCLVYSVINRDSFERITQVWLPFLRNKGVSVPIILVGNKIDRKNTVPSENIVESSEMLSLMGEYKEIETCIECSAKNLTNVTELFYFAQKAVIHPARLLYDTANSSLKPKCINALSRIFWLCDKDGDDVLSHSELNEFQKFCFSSPLNQTELDDILNVVRDSLPSGVVSNGLNLEGFLLLHKLFIQQGRVETTWIVLRKYGYGEDLNLKEEIVYPNIQIDQNCSVELSAEGFEFITQLFRRFDRDQDASLNKNELKKLFSVVPFEEPWKEYNFPSCTVTNGSGNVTLQGWLAMWSMVTLLNYRLTLEFFAYLGFPGDILNGIVLAKRKVVNNRPPRKYSSTTSKLHKLDSNIHSLRYSSELASNTDLVLDKNAHYPGRHVNSVPENYRPTQASTSTRSEYSLKPRMVNKSHFKMFSRNKKSRTTSLVYLVGSKGSGKSSLLNSFTKKPFDPSYSPTESPMVSVNSVELKAEQQYLVLKEFGLYTNMALGNTAVMDNCDLLCMVYDSSDPSSFQYLVELRSSTIQPDDYCRELKLPIPLHVSVKEGHVAEIFEKMASLISKPVSVAIIWGVFFGSYNRARFYDSFLYRPFKLLKIF